MADKEGKEFSFEFKCADFQIEFKGDFNFVQNQLRKYEPKILVKFHQIIPTEKPPAAPAPPSHHPHPQPPAQPQPHPQAQPQKPHYRNERRGFQDKRRGYKRPPDPYKKDEKRPSRDPDFVENSQKLEAGAGRAEPEPKKPEIDAHELRSLLDRYQPRTSHDRVMILAFYLEEKQAGEFSSNEIQECFQALGEKSPGNLSIILNNASRSGFLAKEEKSGKVRYRLTFKGKRYVENGLRLD